MESLIDEMLPIARKVLRERKQIELNPSFKDSRIWKNDSIFEIYENYTSAFPIMIDQMELRSTLALYFLSDSSKSEGNKKVILQLLYNIIKIGKLNTAIHDDWSKMVTAIIDDTSGNIVSHYEEYLSDAAIALKRAIRTFPLTKK